MKKYAILFLMMVIAMPSATLGSAKGEKAHVCFRIVDANTDGEVTFQEFEKFFGNDKERFKKADLDKNGKLSHDEYHELFGHGS